MEEHKGMKNGHWEMQTHPGLITLSLAEILSLTDFLVKGSCPKKKIAYFET